MNKVFNTSLEASLRITILLDAASGPLSMDEICATDFVATYSGRYSDRQSSVNGDNRFMFSEFAARKELAGESLKNLVLRGIVKPAMTKRGFAYELTEEGSTFVSELDGAYAREYRSGAEFACGYVEETGVDDVIFDITNRAAREKR